MMTFKDLKKLVELPSYKEQRVPTVKALEVSGVPVVTEKVLENHGSINVYQNGYVIYRAHKRVTVFSLRDCVHYKYDAAEGAGHHIEEAEFDDYEWHIRLVLEGEDRIFMNYEIIQGKWMPSREDREYKEEILEGVDEAVSTLERMISEERVEELLSTLTDLQRKVVHIHLFHPMDINLNYADDDNPLGMKSDFILSLCELIMGARDGMEPEEKSVIDRCLPLVYQKYLNDPKSENMPILGDLYDCLREQKERQAQRIATALEIYVNGSLRVFNHQTNVELDNRLICFDIKELGKQLKKLGIVRLLALPVIALLYVAGFVLNLLYGICGSIGMVLAGLGGFAAFLALLDGSYAQAVASALVALLLCPFAAPMLLSLAGSALIVAASALFAWLF